ncbi:hypothetical protein IHE44_0011191 [Lamprotornis superbus]|uniref:Tumor necrosis factor alpha-induced protein 8 n=1 Tax=Lamprotornis superbus TaxID=245042 RepID=A0A835NVE8_9PASS|nr:hypothetical protein IHE44_0011191 [Lamprotornis superbus]
MFQLECGSSFAVLATDVFNSKSLAIQAQKKILGKMVSKSIATTLIDDTSSDVLDELYRVTKEYTQNKKEAEKIIKNLIKIVLKLAILYRNNQFNQDEIALMEKFKKKVHQLAKTVVSFHQVDYTFDRNFLSKLLNECRELLHEIIQRHLTAKSHGRVNNLVHKNVRTVNYAVGCSPASHQESCFSGSEGRAIAI